MTYTDMTDEEYDALDEEQTRTIPKFGPPGSGWLEQRELRQLGLAKTSTDYILTKAQAKCLSPAQVIDELVRKEIAAASA
jgi:hypothetical protein